LVDGTAVRLSAFLGAASAPSMVLSFQYTAASETPLAYDFSAVINHGLFRLDAESADAPVHEVCRDLLRQREIAEKAMRANQVMSFFAPEHRRHDALRNSPRW
jgi:hypothetical protein